MDGADTVQLLNALAIGAGVSAGLMAAIDLKAGVRRLFQIVMSWYFVLIYLLSTLDPVSYFVRSGIGTRAGVIIALLLLMVEISAARKSRKNHAH